MTPRLPWVMIVLAAWTTSTLSGCGSETGTADTTAAAGVPGIGTGGSASTGGTASGGKASGGAASGGKDAGGTVANTGGNAEGGRTTGGASAGVATGGVATGGNSSSCLDQITNYASDGPFTYATKTSGSVNLYVPNVPSGCKIPMVHYSNGTGANCLYYAASLKRLATNGFLTLCYENTNTGAGKYGIEAFETALAQYPELADYRFGSTGHSQGGMASLVTLQYAEAEWGTKGIYSALAIEPASGFGDNPTEGWQTAYAKIRSPVFMFSGLVTDTLVSQTWVQQAFDALGTSVEAYFWTKSGANHLTTVNQDGEEVLVAWFRWKLLGDQKACQYWRSLPTTNNAWAVADKRNEIACR